jgi:hypothetical protein
MGVRWDTWIKVGRLVDLALWLFIVGGYWCWRWRWWLLPGLLIAITAGVGVLIYFRLLASGVSAWVHLLAVRRWLVPDSPMWRIGSIAVLAGR